MLDAPHEHEDLALPQGDWLGGGEKKTEKKRKKKKQNVADLDAIYMKSRESLMHFRPQRKTRVRQDEVAADGTRILPELPAFLRGFEDYMRPREDEPDEKPAEVARADQFASIDSVHSRLHFMRKLTDRMQRDDSPEKTVSLVKKKTTLQTQQSGDPDADPTAFDSSDKPSDRAPEEDLPVYDSKGEGEGEGEGEGGEGETKLEPEKVPQPPKNIAKLLCSGAVLSTAEFQHYERLRNERDARRELRADGMVMSILQK